VVESDADLQQEVSQEFGMEWELIKFLFEQGVINPTLLRIHLEKV
jgi:hypothetical protein